MENSQDTSSSQWRPAALSAGLILVLGAMCTVFWLQTSQRDPDALPVLGRIPAFRMLDETARPFELASVLGKVWVADFIFTTCAAACPGMTAAMAEVQKEVLDDAALRDRVRLVSFSIDPRTDTPEVLTEFAREYGADPSLWSFVMGGDGDVARLSRDFFFLAAAQAGQDGGTGTHSDRFALVDSRGRLRGHYRVTESAEERSRLLDDLRRLVAEEFVASGGVAPVSASQSR